MQITDKFKNRAVGIFRFVLELLALAGVLFLMVAFFQDKGAILRGSILWLFG